MVSSLTATLNKIHPTSILIAGDLVLDTYTIGKAGRISPEAPVAVVTVTHSEKRPGMVGNVALNIKALGSEVVLVSRIGDDEAGKEIIDILKNEGINTQGIFIQRGYKTPVKNRIVANHQQIVRVDHETVAPLPELLEDEIVRKLPSFIHQVQAVAISDYAKGFLTPTLLSGMIKISREHQLPIVIDPKGVDFSKYTGATIIKPNYREALLASGLDSTASLDSVAASIMKKAELDMLMITRSEDGAALFKCDGSRKDYPVKSLEVRDVTGAGDTVLAMLTCALANRLPAETAVHLCNVAAGIAVTRFGCARVTLADIAHVLLREDAHDKVYEEEHLFALSQVLKEKPFNLLGLTIEQGITPTLFKHIREVAEDGKDLVIYVRDHDPSEEAISILASLADVDFILVNGESLKLFCDQLTPSAVYLVEQEERKELHTHVALVT
ncbi:MAG: D-glycero-beta-D-manno-heptose-7-phosphate kinase [Chlamydiales bacterium]